MNDIITKSINEGKFIFWEEIARDGAQGKTILNAKQRIDIAKMHSKMFKGNAHKHLVFAAGFTAISKYEVDTIRELADNVNECTIATNCRSNKDEIDLSLDALKNTKYPRIAFVLPFSKRMAHLMTHRNLDSELDRAIDIAKYAVDKANGVPVDVQLAASFDTLPEYVAEASAKFKEQGISIVHLGDTRGAYYPAEVKKYMKKLYKTSEKNITYGVHFHNDIGFALTNNLAAIKQGARLAATSWLGIAERNGITATELLTFILSYEPDKIKKRFGFSGKKLFTEQPDLHMINKIATKAAEYTNTQFKMTDVLVGKGVNSISTGTPFVDTFSFQPFDPMEVLGVKKTIEVTQLASKRVIREKGKLMGYQLSDDEIISILKYVKPLPYKTGRAIFPENELIEIFNKAKKGTL